MVGHPSCNESRKSTSASTKSVPKESISAKGKYRPGTDGKMKKGSLKLDPFLQNDRASSSHKIAVNKHLQGNQVNIKDKVSSLNKESEMSFEDIEAKIFEDASLLISNSSINKEGKKLERNVSKSASSTCKKKFGRDSKGFGIEVSDGKIKSESCQKSRNMGSSRETEKCKSAKNTTKRSFKASNSTEFKGFKSEEHISKGLNSSDKSKDKKVIHKKGLVSSKSKPSLISKVPKKEEPDSDVSDLEELNEVDELTSWIREKKGLVEEEKSIQIKLNSTDNVWSYKKRKRRSEQDLFQEYLRRYANRGIKEDYENRHKVHLLCLLAHGRFLNSLLNQQDLLACGLSLVTRKSLYPPKRLNLTHLEQFLKWFSEKITLDTSQDVFYVGSFSDILQERFSNRKALSAKEFVLMFVIVCRAVGMTTRLVLNLVPLTWKPPMNVLFRPPKEEEEKDIVDNEGVDAEKYCAGINLYRKSIEKNTSEKGKSSCQERIPEPELLSKKGSSSKSECKTEGLSTKVSRTNGKGKSGHVDGKKGSQNKRLKKDVCEDDDFDGQSTNKLEIKRKKSNQPEKGVDKAGDNKGEVKKKKKRSLDEWVELYVEEEEKWICVDVISRKIHCAKDIEMSSSSSMGYVTAFNPDLTMKDVTKRYVTSWLSSEHKNRCDSSWWNTTISHFRGPSNRKDKEEDEELDMNLKMMPLPKTIGEYKNHSLYALQRHLLKFEAIHPPDLTPVGFIRDEPVYPRENVKLLRSRDTWIKEAKTVKVGEKPYKIVKARPKWDSVRCIYFCD